MAQPTTPDIGAYYQCFRQPKAFLCALGAYRRSYPSTTLVVLSDNGLDFSGAVARHGGQWIHDANQSGNDRTNALCSSAKAKMYLTRFFDGAKRMREPYFMLLEDDVHVVGRVSAASLRFDLTGCNNAGARMWPEIVADLKARGVDEAGARYYGGCGGSVFRTAFFQELPGKIEAAGGLDALLDAYGTLNPKYDSDILLSYITLRFGGTVGGPPSEFGDLTNPDWQARAQRGEIKVLHDFKFLYNIPLTIEESRLLGWMS